MSCKYMYVTILYDYLQRKPATYHVTETCDHVTQIDVLL